MIPVPTALLLHTTRHGQHHDWLLGDPDRRGDPAARLWTARVDPPSGDWAGLQQFTLTRLPPHRSIYLRYQGPISGNRGEVRRVDAGYALVLLWRAERIILAVRMSHFTGRIALVPLAGDQWEARVLDQ